MFLGEPVMVLLLLAGAGWIWSAAMRAREYVLARCRRICEQMQVQLLDQTVALARLSLGRDSAGRLRVNRRYAFEFSTDGSDRHRGLASMLGEEIQFIRLEHPEGPVIITDTR